VSRFLALATVSVLLLSSASVHADGVGGATGSPDPGGSSQISTWVIGAVNGGVGHPPGTSSCTPWTLFDGSTFEGGLTPNPVVINPATGLPATIYFRTCGSVTQFVYVGPHNPVDVARVAYQKVASLVPDPQVAFSPPIDKMIVNFETWLGLTPSAPITATATIPGLSATVTAEATDIEWATGSQIAGDTTMISCHPWGSTKSAQDGCAWTPAYPSVGKVTGTTDERYHGTVTIIWQVSWQATNGASGALGELRTTTPIEMGVQEIQTIGG
jgi:hypothetical protein